MPNFDAQRNMQKLPENLQLSRLTHCMSDVHYGTAPASLPLPALKGENRVIVMAGDFFDSGSFPPPTEAEQGIINQVFAALHEQVGEMTVAQFMRQLPRPTHS